jgi:hypothetical protein
MKTTTTLLMLLVAGSMSLLPLPLRAADARRHAEVVERGKDVMPFSVEATTHVFTRTPDGGIQRVVAKNARDAATTKSIRLHLHDIRRAFLAGDFAGPAHIHGDDMPGLAALRSAKPGQLTIVYRDVRGGGELVFRSHDGAVVAALHEWFDAQLADHGADAMEGHAHQHR